MLSVGCEHNSAIVRGWARITSRQPQVKSNGESNLELDGVHWLKECVLDKHLIQVRCLSVLLVFVIKFQLLLLKKTFLMHTAFWKKELVMLSFNVESIKKAVDLWAQSSFFLLLRSDSFLVNQEYWAVLLNAFWDAICHFKNMKHKNGGLFLDIIYFALFWSFFNSLLQESSHLPASLLLAQHKDRSTQLELQLELPKPVKPVAFSTGIKMVRQADLSFCWCVFGRVGEGEEWTGMVSVFIIRGIPISCPKVMCLDLIACSICI